MLSVPAFKAFLSHRYKSPEMNQYFFEIFAERAAVEFDVDPASGSTNVTRLQRLIRSSHGFIGIYPYVPERPEPLTAADLRSASSYFRLEIGLALRARKPILIFMDRRFGSVIDLPSWAPPLEFDYRELTGGGASPSRATFADAFERFIRQVKAGMAYDLTMATRWRTNRIGLLLPSDSAYSGPVIDALQVQIDELGGEALVIRWPKSIDSRFLSAVESCDFIILDVGPAGDAGGVPSFLEAWFSRGFPKFSTASIAARWPCCCCRGPISRARTAFTRLSRRSRLATPGVCKCFR